MTEDKQRPEEDEEVQGHDWRRGPTPIIPQEDTGDEVEGHGGRPDDHRTDDDVEGRGQDREDQIDDVEGHHIRRPGDDPRIIP